MIIREIISNPKKFLFENLGLKQIIIKNTFWLVLSETISRSLTLFLIVYIARVLGAGEYGKLTFALSFASFFFLFSDLGINGIFTRELSREKIKEREFPAIFSLKTLLSFLTLGIIFLGSFFVTQNLLIRTTILILGAFLVINSITDVFNAFFQARQKMEYQAIVQITQALFLFLLGLFVLFHFPLIKNIAFVYLFSAIISFIFALFLFRKKYSFLKISFKIKDNINIWKNYLKISWPLALIGILGGVLANIDSIMMGYLGQINQVGWYQAAYKVINFVFIPVKIIYVVFFPVLGCLINKSQEPNEKFETVFNVFFKIMIFLAFLFCIGGMVLAPQIINWLYGNKFIPSILTLRILLLMAGFVFLITPLNQWLILTNKQIKLFYIMTIGTVANIFLNLFLIPVFSLYGAAISIVISFFLMFLLVFIVLQKTMLNVFKKMVKIFVFAIISGAGLYYIISQPIIFNLNPLFSSIIGFLGYSGIFIILNIFFLNTIKKLVSLFVRTKYFVGKKAKISFVALSFIRIIIWPIKLVSYKYYLYLWYFVVGHLFQHLFQNAKIKIYDKSFILQNIEDLFILCSEKELESFVPEKGRVFLDVGAHIGKYSIFYEERFEKIIAVEPEPRNFFYLDQNIKLNNLEEKIRAINLAFYNKNREKIILNRGRYNVGGHTITEQIQDKRLYKDQISIETITMDDLTKKEKISPKEIDFIKIDVEGAEALVLEGGKETLKEGNPKILFEVWRYNQESLKKCKEILEELNYQIKQITSDYYFAEKR